jgi:hypothetical protein
MKGKIKPVLKMLYSKDVHHNQLLGTLIGCLRVYCGVARHYVMEIRVSREL